METSIIITAYLTAIVVLILSAYAVQMSHKD